MLRSSLNGFTTRGKERDDSVWASPEDGEILRRQIEQNNLIVMGRKTFDAARSHIKLDPSKLRVVLTRNPRKYKNLIQTGVLEFSDEEPVELVKRLGKAGYDRMLLFGGSETAARFFKGSLINELLLTVEPYIFDKGTPIISDQSLEVGLKLLDFQRLNTRGTLHLRYQVIKNGV